jgi:protein-S-isoprenylcysteine O-methyltransferase Ste14
MISANSFEAISIAEKALLVICFGIAGYITKLCFSSPNPRPAVLWEGDRFLRDLAGYNLPHMREWAFVLITIAHIAIIMSFPDNISSTICPHPENVNPIYFRFTPYVLVCLSLIYTAGAMRLWAYATLGSSFTFELARPKKLVTTGIYKHIQHPSYPPDVVLCIANFALFTAPDGVMGCFLPPWLAQWKWPAILAINVIYVPALAVRVIDEERMLKETFGKEWEAWHAKTARFIPGVV